MKTNDNTLKVDTNKLNKYFSDTEARLVSQKSMSKKELTSLIDSFNDKENAFQLQPVTYENIEKCIKMIRNDCSTGYDHVPATFIKSVSEFLASPITFIINNFIKINQFPPESVQFQKYNYQWNLKTTDQYPFYQFYQRLTKELF